jgi:hypothetical protein
MLATTRQKKETGRKSELVWESVHVNKSVTVYKERQDERYCKTNPSWISDFGKGMVIDVSIAKGYRCSAVKRNASMAASCFQGIPPSTQSNAKLKCPF